MTANTNIKLGEMYCNARSVPQDVFLQQCVTAYERKHACKPPMIQMSTADKAELAEHDGIRVVYDPETPQNHARLEVVR